MIELTEEQLGKIIKLISDAYTTKIIEVNDGNDDKRYRVSAIQQNGYNRIVAHLVLEEDGEINFYFNPDEHSDLILHTIWVFKDYKWKV